MRCYTVTDFDTPTEGISVALRPNPHIWLGKEERKPPYWVRIKKRDSIAVIQPVLVPCGDRIDQGLNQGWEHTNNPWTQPLVRHCPFCGTRFTPWEWGYGHYTRYHPKEGEMVRGAAIFDVDIIPTNDRGQGKYLVVKPTRPPEGALVLLSYANRRYIHPDETGYVWKYHITHPKGCVSSLSAVTYDGGRGGRVVEEVVQWLFVVQAHTTLNFKKTSAPETKIYPHEGSLRFDGEKLTLH